MSSLPEEAPGGWRKDLSAEARQELEAEDPFGDSKLEFDWGKPLSAAPESANSDGSRRHTVPPPNHNHL